MSKMILLQDGVTCPHEGFICLGKERKSHFSEITMKNERDLWTSAGLLCKQFSKQSYKISTNSSVYKTMSANYLQVFQVRTTFSPYFTFINLINSVCMWSYICCRTIHKKQFSPFTHGFWGLLSSLQAWYEAPLPTDLSHLLKCGILNFLTCS